MKPVHRMRSWSARHPFFRGLAIFTLLVLATLVPDAIDFVATAMTGGAGFLRPTDQRGICDLAAGGAASFLLEVAFWTPLVETLTFHAFPLLAVDVAWRCTSRCGRSEVGVEVCPRATKTVLIVGTVCASAMWFSSAHTRTVAYLLYTFVGGLLYAGIFAAILWRGGWDGSRPRSGSVSDLASNPKGSDTRLVASNAPKQNWSRFIWRALWATAYVATVHAAHNMVSSAAIGYLSERGGKFCALYRQ